MNHTTIYENITTEVGRIKEARVEFLGVGEGS